MHVSYLPPDMESLNDAISLETVMALVMRYARRHKAFASVKVKFAGASCENCGKPAREIHHIKPIWSLAAEYVMNRYVIGNESIKRYRVVRATVNERELDATISTWHTIKNLEPLCCECHTKQQAIDDRQWKIKLAKKYRLVFTRRWADLRIRLQSRDDLSVYVDKYFVDMQSRLEKEIREIK